ncbi:SWIM zinc finger family protein [Streptomyces sp. NPDC004542]|uniref:SWIM zinc finger family protein n=1 Tax=Streptomyces sp. NPDC004542 TaxID=3154281 RepID=UPI0033A98014
MTGGERRPGDVARRALREALDARERGSGPPWSEHEAVAAEGGTGPAPGAGPGTVPGPAGDGARDERTPGPGAGDEGAWNGTARDEKARDGTARGEEPSPRPRPAVPGRDAPRPGDAARAALRTAVAARRDVGAAAEHGPGPAARVAAARPPQEPAPDAGHRRPAPEAVPESRGPAGPGGRPGDIAREALRAARRATREADPADGTGPVDGTGPADRPAPAGGDDPRRVERRRAAREMREFLATAFRMPSMSDEPDEPHEPHKPYEPHEPHEPHKPYEPDEPHEPDEPSHPEDPPARATVPGPPAPSPTAATSPATPAPAAAPPAQEAPPLPPVPHTMATPHRDHELRRTFPALPARPSQGARFAGTWWGNAWVDALEQGALDVRRLARGRGYAEQGHVDAITVTPGLVLAYVRGSRPRPYRVQVRLRTLEEADWERFLDAAADRPGHIAALLDKELPHSLADCGVPLLPGPGDLAPRCSCPDSGHPCKHAAALCYQTARLLDADPFVLLLLRGRGERDLLDALSRRSAARAARADGERQPASLPGVRATDALAPRGLPPLPPPLPAPPHPQQPPVYPAAPGGPDPFALDQLATDAAARAHTLLTTGRDPVGDLTLWQDAVRQAAARPGTGLTASTRALYSALAAAAGRTPAELARAVAAWRQGGPEGLTVLEEPWDPPAGRFDRARPLLLAAGLPAFRPWRNRLTHPRGHVQLRLGRDGSWYAYESEPDHDDWWPRGTPDPDPVGALTGQGTSGGA